jgi:hypothetical protein
MEGSRKVHFSPEILKKGNEKDLNGQTSPSLVFSNNLIKEVSIELKPQKSENQLETNITNNGPSQRDPNSRPRHHNSSSITNEPLPSATYTKIGTSSKSAIALPEEVHIASKPSTKRGTKSSKKKGTLEKGESKPNPEILTDIQVRERNILMMKKKDKSKGLINL